MGVTVGPVGDDRAAEYLAAMGQAFGSTPATNTGSGSPELRVGPGRAACDGDRIVGTLGAYSFEMTVPGGTMPCGGTTVVAVLHPPPAGVLRQMIESHRGRPGAVSPSPGWASGPASTAGSATGLPPWARREVDRTRRFHRSPRRRRPASSRGGAMDLFPPFYDRGAACSRVSSPGRRRGGSSAASTTRALPGRATAFRYAVTEENGVVTGFAQYRFKEVEEGHGRERSRPRTARSTPESWAGLWSLVLNHDLTAGCADNRSVDDPLFGLWRHRNVPHHRRRQPVDQGPRRSTALEGRAYSASVSAVVGLHDPTDATTTTWRLDLSPDGAEVTPADSDPQVEMDMEDLGHASWAGPGSRLWPRRAASGETSPSSAPWRLPSPGRPDLGAQRSSEPVTAPESSPSPAATARRPAESSLSRRVMYGLLAVVVVSFGVNWPVMSAGVRHISPVWMGAFRVGSSLLVFACMAVARGRLRLPPRSDWPIVASLALFGMSAVNILVFTALQIVPPGRSSVLTWTTPLWAVPIAAVFLGDRMTRSRWAGLALGIAGVVVLFELWRLGGARWATASAAHSDQRRRVRIRGHSGRSPRTPFPALAGAASRW